MKLSQVWWDNVGDNQRGSATWYKCYGTGGIGQVAEPGQSISKDVSEVVWKVETK